MRTSPILRIALAISSPAILACNARSIDLAALAVNESAPPAPAGVELAQIDSDFTGPVVPAAGGETVIRLNRRGETLGPWNSFDVTSILAWPVGIVVEGLRFLVVEDADAFWFQDRAFDVFLVTKATPSDAAVEDASWIDQDDPFTVKVTYLAIDNFVEGRLRDSLGGDGGELSLQVSMAALNDRGELLDEDFAFLNEEIVKRRFPLLLALEATQAGKDALADARTRIGEARTELAQQERKTRMKQALDTERNKPADRSRDRGLRAASDAVVADLRQSRPELAPVAAVILERARGRLRNTDPTGVPTESDLAAAVAAVPTEDLLASLLTTLGGVEKDEAGLYEEVRVIQSLAQADRLMQQEFTGIRPLAWSDAGTASQLIPESTADAPARGYFQRDKDLIFHGSLADLSKLGAAHGFSLSVLLLERDSDRIVDALALVERYAEERNLSVNAGGLPIEIAPLAQALGVLAQQIAEEDVELKCIDLRFASALDPYASGTPILKLREGKVLVTRNADGHEFGAIAVIEIKKDS